MTTIFITKREGVRFFGAELKPEVDFFEKFETIELKGREDFKCSFLTHGEPTEVDVSTRELIVSELSKWLVDSNNLIFFESCLENQGVVSFVTFDHSSDGGNRGCKVFINEKGLFNISGKETSCYFIIDQSGNFRVDLRPNMAEVH